MVIFLMCDVEVSENGGGSDCVIINAEREVLGIWEEGFGANDDDF